MIMVMNLIDIILRIYTPYRFNLSRKKRNIFNPNSEGFISELDRESCGWDCGVGTALWIHSMNFRDDIRFDR